PCRVRPCGSRGVEQTVRPVLGQEQGLYPLPQGRVAGARLGEVGRPSCRVGQVPGGGEDVALAHGGTPGPMSPHLSMREHGPNYATVPKDFSTAAGYPSSRRESTSQARAYAQSLSAVRGEMPSAAAVSATVRPAKYRSLTTSAARGSTVASRSRASSSSSRRADRSGPAGYSGSTSSPRRRP